jgi:predicted RNA-binding protein with PIN domain
MVAKEAALHFYDHIIIDGNNVLNHDCRLWDGTPFETARWKLARVAERMLGRLADKVTVVFDGAVAEESGKTAGGALTVLFSNNATDADTVIERMVLGSARTDRILVATSDRMESDAVAAAGAETMRSESFIQVLLDAASSQAVPVDSNRKNKEGATLGDFFPDSSEKRN